MIHYLKNHESHLHFTGLHAHAGSQVLDAESIAAYMKMALEQANEIYQKWQLPVEKINIGGGWGVNYFPNQKKLNLDHLADILMLILSQQRFRSMLGKTRLIIEPGRYLIAEIGIYAAKVLYRKKNSDREFAIVDGGMHHNYVLAGGMGQVIRRNFEMDILHQKKSLEMQRSRFKITIAGKLCTPQDILAVDYESQAEALPGDIVVFFNCGAYGLTASPNSFLSHNKPGEIFISKKLV
ncbi:hypothetical protein JXJ21_15295 [candidate division KSB1 bacterium]|nr:hypothetical protein [candidate division KSB1 bacterium]